MSLSCKRSIEHSSLDGEPVRSPGSTTIRLDDTSGFSFGGHSFRAHKAIPLAERGETVLDDELILRVSPQVAAALRGALEAIEIPPYGDFDGFLEAAAAIFLQIVPGSVRERLCNIEDARRGLLVVDGLPIDRDLPTTPSAGGSLPPRAKATHVVEGCLAGIASLLPAEPFNYRQEAMGTAPIIDNVVPLKDRPFQQGAGGFRDNFPFHTESAWHRITPDYVLLSGVRGDEACFTIACALDDALAHLDDTTKQVLASSEFVLGAPQLYHQMVQRGVALGTLDEVTVPIVQRHPERGWWTARVNCNGTTCMSNESLAALSAFEDALYAAAARIVLRPGRMIVMDNRRMIHTRTGYEPRFDGSDRWFQRMNMSNRLWHERPVSVDALIPHGVSLEELRDAGWLDTHGCITRRVHEIEANERAGQGNLPMDKRLLDTLLQHGPSPGVRIV